MPEIGTDSISAANRAVRALLLAILIGAIAGAITRGFILASSLGVQALWETLPRWCGRVPERVVHLLVIALMTLAAALTAHVCKRRPFDSGATEAEYHEQGRIGYRHLFSGILFSLASLFSGAAVGLEAPLTAINGGMGTRVAELFRLEPWQVKVMAYSGVAGAFGALFGAAHAGALLAAELLSPKSIDLNRTTLAAGLVAGASSWVAYALLGGGTLPPILLFPDLPRITFVSLGMALLLGVLGGWIGLAYLRMFQKMRLGLAPLRDRPWLGALAGGGATLLAAILSPYLLFSGQEQVGPLLRQAGEIGVFALLVIGVAKLVLSGWGLSTAYFGGPIFPLIFSGASFGLAAHLLAPSIPAGVAVTGIIAGMVAAAAAAPLSITVFLGLISDPALLPVIAIAAVGAFIVRQAVAPLAPGVYWVGAAKTPLPPVPSPVED